MVRQRKTSMADQEQFFADERTRFAGVVKHALLISNSIGRQKTAPPRVMASWLFMRACVTANTIKSLHEPLDAGYGAKYLDHASIASLCRGLIENIAVLRYVGDVSINAHEWACRKYVIDLHDYRNRTAFLTAIGQQKDDERKYAFLTERLIQNSYFRTIPEKRQKRLLDGEDMFINGRHAAMLEFGWGENITKGIYKYLSNQVHSLPMAFHRTELNAIYEQNSLSAKVSAGFATEFGRKALGYGCLHMITLFPHVEAKFNADILAALRAEYTGRS